MPTNIVLRQGPVQAEISLIKTSTEPKAAKWATMRVLVDATVVPTIETPEQAARHSAVMAMGGVALGDDPMTGDDPMMITSVPSTVDAVAAIAPHFGQGGGRIPVIPQTPEQSIARDSAMVRNVPAATTTLRGISRDGEFVDLTEQLAKIDELAKIDGMEIVGAINPRVPRSRIRESYWIAPQNVEAVGVLKLIYAGLVANGLALAVKWTKTTNQAVGVIVPIQSDGGLMLIEVEFAAKMNKIPAKAKIAGEVTDQEMAAVTKFLTVLKGSRADLDAVTDVRREMQADLLDRARAGDAEAWAPLREIAPDFAEFERMMAEVA